MNILPHSFCGSGTWAQLNWVLWIRSSQDCSQGDHQSHSHLKVRLEEEPLPSSLRWLLTRFSSSWVVGLKASVSHQLLAGNFLCSLPRGPLHRAAQRMAAGLPSGWTSKRATEGEQDRSQSLFVTWSRKWHTISFAIFHSYAASH